MVKTKKGQSAESISHPNSRKVVQLSKQIKKIEKRKKSKNFHVLKQNIEGVKYIWFRDHLNSSTTECTHEMLANLIEQYLDRFDDELNQIKIKNTIGQRKSRQHASREDVIALTKLQERFEYENAGIELPDILQRNQLSMLMNWNGQLRFLQNFKLRRFNKKFLTSKVQISRPPSPDNMNIEMAEGSKISNMESEENKMNKPMDNEISEVVDSNSSISLNIEDKRESIEDQEMN
uniref:Translation machinery-associated protein 16 n=1 Tax=Clastoptera arizonana TaxID=38151 RepID=A0A1B6E4P4_9HEMI